MQQPSVAGMQQPSVAGMQQPTIVLPNRKKTKPFMLRGARFSNGRQCPGSVINGIVGLGIGISIVGLLTIALLDVNSFGWNFLLIIGVVLTVIGLYLLNMAARQYNELPADHPDRLMYGSGYTLPVQTVDGVSTYQYPPGAQIPGGYPDATTWQPRPYPAQTAVFPPPPAGQAGYRVPATGQMGIGQPGVCPVPQGGQTYQPSAPIPEHYMDDLPPPYSEVIKDTK